MAQGGWSRTVIYWQSPSAIFPIMTPLPASPSHPSDEKEHSSSFPRNISAASLGSLMSPHHHSANHTHQPEPLVTDPLMGTLHTTVDADTRIDMEKNDVQVSVRGFPNESQLREFFTILILLLRLLSITAEGADPGVRYASVQIQT